MPRPHTFSSPQRKAQYKKKLLIKMGILLVLILALIAGGIYSLHLPFWRVSTIVVIGNEVEEAPVIAELAKSIIKEKSFFVFPKDNVLIIPLPVIEAHILDAFPRIKEVQTKRTGLTAVEITVVERHPHALWCLPDTSCYYIDETAIGYALAPTFSDAVYIKYIKEGISDAPIRKTLLPEATYTHVGELVAFLNAKGYLISEISISKDEKEAFLSLAKGPEIRIALSENLSALADVIVAVFSNEPLASANLSSIAYLDMRFGKKIYYRFVGENSESGTAILPNEE